jgi:hypothetical protein
MSLQLGCACMMAWASRPALSGVSLSGVVLGLCRGYKVEALSTPNTIVLMICQLGCA